MSKTTAKKLFYRISPANEGLVFARSADAEKNHTIRTAIESSKTWGEFRRAVGNHEYLAVLRAMKSLDDDEPVEISSDKDRFDCEL